MIYDRLHYIPLIFSTILLASLIISYVWAVSINHVTAVLPYISETASYPPESCVFTQLFSFGTVLLGASVYIRYRQVSELVTEKRFSKWKNLVTAWIGFIATLGFNMVGSFQEANIISIHLLVTGACVGCGTLYFCLQSWISFKMSPRIHRDWVLHLRTALSVLSVISLLIVVVFALASLALFNGDDIYHWSPDDGGWTLHVISAVAEYILVICFSLYILTFIKDFSIIKLHPPQIEIAVPIIGNSA